MRMIICSRWQEAVLSAKKGNMLSLLYRSDKIVITVEFDYTEQTYDKLNVIQCLFSSQVLVL